MTRLRAVVVLVVFVLVAAGCSRGSTAPVVAAETPIQRGEYLVSVMGCHDCHTPLTMGPHGPAPDMSRMLSGHPQALVMPAPPAPEGPWIVAGAGTLTAWSGPWGVSFAANLTPDEETGLGLWDETMFELAMRKGRHLGAGRDILPPMPWQNIAKLSDEDLHAVFVYLGSIPAVNNLVPEAIITER